MTSATTSHARGARQGEGYGMIVFALALLVTVGFFNVIDGIAAIANSHIFIADAHYVVGDLRAWGWVSLILGALQILAAGGILAGNQAARWFAVAVVGLNAISQMLFIPAYPFWSLLIIAIRRSGPVGTVRLWKPGEPDRLAAQFTERAPGWTWRTNVHPRGIAGLGWRARLDRGILSVTVASARQAAGLQKRPGHPIDRR